MQIELIDIHKHFGPVHANNGVSMTIPPGSIHGILGENGAGKSTLMKILSGMIEKTSGTIRIDGVPVVFYSPADAMAAGIGMLHQDPLDFPRLTALENFALGRRSDRGRRNDLRRLFLETCDRFGFNLPPEVTVGSLTVGERQQLEIVRLVALGVRALILDEPTTGISSLQKESLFQSLNRLKASGNTLLLVSHKLEDVEALCDRAVVLRRGMVSGEEDSPFDRNRLLHRMFGKIPVRPAARTSAPGAPILELRDVSARGGRTGLRSCSVTVFERELVGLAGLAGSGQGTLLRVAAGLIRPLSGSVRIRGRSMTGRGHPAFRRTGVNFFPAARLEEGLIPGLSIREHIAVGKNGDGRGLYRSTTALEKARTHIEAFCIRGEPETPVEALSGGNQQRLLLSFLKSHAGLLLLEHPTRGLDVESANFVWERLCAFGEQGAAVLFASAELDEMIAVADRILVFFEGALVKSAKTRDIDVEALGRAIAGIV